MGVIIKVNDTTFTNTVGIAEYPILDSLTNLYYMGDTEAASIVDHSGKGNAASVSGSISYGTKYASFTGAGTDNMMTAQNITGSLPGVTAIAMFRKSGNRAIFSNGSGTVFAGALQISPERTIYVSDTDEALRDIRYTLADGDNFYICAWSLTATTYSILCDNATNGIYTLASGTGTGSSVKLYINTTATLKKLAVGGSVYNYAMNGSLDLAVAAFYNTALTTAQIQEAFAFLRIYGEKNGLTIN